MDHTTNRAEAATDCDVLVIGGGLVGLTSAVASSVPRRWSPLANAAVRALSLISSRSVSSGDGSTPIQKPKSRTSSTPSSLTYVQSWR
jgi:hypothetical protein